MRSEDYSSWSVSQSVSLCVDHYSWHYIYEAAYKRHQWLHKFKSYSPETTAFERYLCRENK